MVNENKRVHDKFIQLSFRQFQMDSVMILLHITLFYNDNSSNPCNNIRQKCVLGNHLKKIYNRKGQDLMFSHFLP